jgi:hypothetical protein
MKGFPMHPKIEDALQQIDAALFNGDTFDDEENRAALQEYVDRWQRKLRELSETTTAQIPLS